MITVTKMHIEISQIRNPPKVSLAVAMADLISKPRLIYSCTSKLPFFSISIAVSPFWSGFLNLLAAEKELIV